MTDAARLIHIAVNLLSEDGENPEYDRACVEIVTEFLGLSMDEREAVLGLLRSRRDRG